MSEDVKQEGIALAIRKLQSIYSISDEIMMEILGDSVYTAIMQNNYDYITIGDMQKLADAVGLVFVMNFQSVDQYLAGSKENEK